MPSTTGSGAIRSRSTPVIACTVLISETPSAPPRFAAAAGARMSVTFGVSFTITGIRVCCLHQRVTIST